MCFTVVRFRLTDAERRRDDAELKKTSRNGLWQVYLLSDVFAIVAAYYSMFYLRFRSEWGRGLYGLLNRAFGVREPAYLGTRMELFYAEQAPRMILFVCVTICLLYAFLNLYAGRRFLLRRPIAWNILLANGAALGLFYCYFYARWNVFHPRTVFMTVIAFNILYCPVFRAAVSRLLLVLRRKFHVDECPAVLVGAGDDASLLEEFIGVERPLGLFIVEKVDSGGETGALLGAVEESVRRHSAEMIICADRNMELPAIVRVIELSEKLEVEVKILSARMNVLATRTRLSVDIVRDVPLVHFARPPVPAWYLCAKRAVSVAAAFLGLLVLFPFLLTIAVLIRLTSRGPAFFKQERVGMNRAPFTMYKFRTMHHLADEEQAQIEEFNESGGGLFKIRKDPRITPVGRLLRKLSIDELPQLINVIRGDMTIVGPRPLPRRDLEHYYEDWHYTRHSGLPGITCLWQISGRSDLDFQSMCILDLYYLRNQCPILDLWIVMRTFVAVFLGRGAY